MMDCSTEPATFRCDGGCGAEAPAIEARSSRGTLVYAWLPTGWAEATMCDGRIRGRVLRAQMCCGCVRQGVRPFEWAREAFAARVEQLGEGLAADIALSLGLPIEIGARWAEETVCD